MDGLSMSGGSATLEVDEVHERPPRLSIGDDGQFFVEATVPYRGVDVAELMGRVERIGYVPADDDEEGVEFTETGLRFHLVHVNDLEEFPSD